MSILTASIEKSPLAADYKTALSTGLSALTSANLPEREVKCVANALNEIRDELTQAKPNAGRLKGWLAVVTATTPATGSALSEALAKVTG
ncbi:hypothetical protein FRUB_00790 [Fimbriiglobus ruber]|uniref:Uncharacterized protein n=1 Tax=Fimbriiglobus ruber TaxID=1908690 RepID=A0A225E0G8_9BACT|nr:hypothetical protein FRUB_00790 [Fimbriiglobus ruber]